MKDIVTGFFSESGVPIAELSIFLGSAGGNFSEATTSPVFVIDIGYEQIATADFNNDGLPDLATANADGSVTVLINSGNAQFDPALVSSQLSGFGKRLTTSDFNGDGNTDILSSVGNRYQFLAGDGGGGFTEASDGPFFSESIIDSAVAAIDSDTVADAVFLERASFPSRYRIQTLLSTRAQAGLSPTMLDFLEVEVGETSNAQDVVISSTGDRGLEVESVSLTGANPSQFAIESDACSGEVISPGADCMISIVFSPLEPGPWEADLQVLTNAESSPDSIGLTGEGEVSNQPFLKLTPENVDFGDVAIGAEPTLFSLIENFGDENLEIGDISVSEINSSDYTLDVDNCSNETLPPNELCNFSVQFAPSKTGIREAAIEIPSNADGSPDVQAYTGSGIEAPVIVFLPDDVFAFEPVAVGSTAESGQFMIENSGSAELVINNLSLQGQDADEFDLITDQCSGQGVAVGETCAFELSFTPVAEGIKFSRVVVDSNLPFFRNFGVEGEGIAGNPELDLMPDSIDFGNVAGDGVSGAASISFSNPGAGRCR